MTIIPLQRLTKGEYIHGNKPGYWSGTLKRLCGMDWAESMGRTNAGQNLIEEKPLVWALERKEMEEKILMGESILQCRKAKVEKGWV